MLRIQPVCQQYAWGKVGKESLVAMLAESGADKGTFSLEEDKPYAELWMGTHPSGPGVIRSAEKTGNDGKLLKEWLADKPEAVGRVPAGYSGNNLPFLLKVLSIRTALSIQAHPDKKLAEELHSNFPDVYKDANHKPEMAIALTEFEGMNGFRPIAEIAMHLKSFPELAAVLGADTCGAVNKAVSDGVSEQPSVSEGVLRTVLKAILSADEALASTQLDALIARLRAEQAAAADSFLTEIVIRLSEQYPGDRGALFPLILNTVALNPGEAYYMAANEPHAYISGDIVECMALSDNVVRAGLTPKFKDKATLERMLTYQCAEVAYCAPQQLDTCRMLYRPPSEGFPEFEVERIAVIAGSTYDVAAQPCASMLVLTQSGKGATYSCGDTEGSCAAAGGCFFQKANTALRLQAGTADMVLFRAHINLG